MWRWLKYYFDLGFLKAAPQDAPASSSMLLLSILSFWLVVFSILLFSQNYFTSVLLASMQCIIILFMTNLTLVISNKDARHSQSLNAIMGASALLLILWMPVFAWLSHLESLPSLAYMFIWLVLVTWQAAIIGNVFKHALEIPFLAGLGIALIFTYMTLAVTVRLLRLLNYPVAN